MLIVKKFAKTEQTTSLGLFKFKYLFTFATFWEDKIWKIE